MDERKARGLRKEANALVARLYAIKALPEIIEHAEKRAKRRSKLVKFSRFPAYRVVVSSSNKMATH
jgi:hypothetical protein